MRIMVTGINGQVGEALGTELASIGTVLYADRTVIDLARPNQIAAALDAAAPDLLINTAAYTAVDQAEEERDLAFRINAESPRAMARWAATNDVPLVHFSTDYVFDGSGEYAWAEEAPTNPLSVYGASKLAGEHEVRSAGGRHLVIRTSWVYAARGKNFLTTIVRLAREREELRIVADQIGAPTSAQTLATTLARILTEPRHRVDGRSGAFLAQQFEAANGLIHVANTGQTSWHGFACAIVEGLKMRGMDLAVRKITPIATEDFPTSAARPRNSRLSMERLSSAYGLKTPNWQDALANELDTVTLA